MSLPQASKDDSVKGTGLHEQIFLVKRTLARNPNYVLAAFVVIIFYLSSFQGDTDAGDKNAASILKVLAKYDGCEVPTPPKQSKEPKTIFLAQVSESES
jgi:hypothetical protein